MFDVAFRGRTAYALVTFVCVLVWAHAPVSPERSPGFRLSDRTASRSGTADLLPNAIVSTKPSRVGDETAPVV